MTHFGLLCPAASGHLDPEFEAIGADDYPEGSTRVLFARLGERCGTAALRATLTYLQRSTEVPLVAIPIANDQPGVAARMAWSGTGAVVPLKRLTEGRRRRAIEQVPGDASFRHHATRLQTSIQHAGGVARAADLLEQAIRTGRPVLRESEEPRHGTPRG